ncbi:Coatomer subunit alpha-2 [Camellia lanceoleosa]|uniref:Coatomer subunit alpha-2 n=1 Tax=Camellia lanceoleosa TaxID=1840588 RepID=A0ACC0IIP6_9ERIC|nr:Coatomer subunit alpha-2 [Camellia lanceoleosa]
MTGNLLCRAEDRVVIFDLQQRIILGDLQTPFVKYIIWSNDMESVALLSKHAIVISSKKLVHQCTLHDSCEEWSLGRQWGFHLYNPESHQIETEKNKPHKETCIAEHETVFGVPPLPYVGSLELPNVKLKKGKELGGKLSSSSKMVSGKSLHSLAHSASTQEDTNM